MLAQRLRLARKCAGFSVRTLSEKLNPRVSAQAIARFESQKSVPSAVMLVELAKTLNVSLNFLMSTQIERLEGLDWQKNGRLSAMAKAQTELTIVDYLERYLAIECVFGNSIENKGLQELKRHHITKLSQVEDLADEVRDLLGLGSSLISSVCVVVEDLGFKVILDNFPECVNGVTCSAVRKKSKVCEAVVLSTKVNVEARRLILARVLAHHVLGWIRGLDIEFEAAKTRLASAVLIPRQHIRTVVGAERTGMTHWEVKDLTQLYGVSPEFILGRLGETRLLALDVVNEALATFSNLWRKEESSLEGPLQNFRDFEEPRRFQRLVCRALGERLISPVRAAELLKKPLLEVERIAKGV